MNPLIGLLCVAAVAPAPEWTERARIDELFRCWAEARDGLCSLDVQFTLTRKDPVFRTETRGKGRLRVAKDAEGELFGSYECSETQEGKVVRTRFLLHRSNVFWLRDDTREYTPIAIPPKDPVLFIADCFHPLVMLLDRGVADRRCSLSVAKTDEWYRYLDLASAPGERKHRSEVGLIDAIHCQSFDRARLVIARESSLRFGVFMPRQFWVYNRNYTETLWDFTTFRLNAPGGPKADDFPPPKELPGWKALPEWKPGIPWWKGLFQEKPSKPR